MARFRFRQLNAQTSVEHRQRSVSCCYPSFSGVRCSVLSSSSGLLANYYSVDVYLVASESPLSHKLHGKATSQQSTTQHRDETRRDCCLLPRITLLELVTVRCDAMRGDQLWGIDACVSVSVSSSALFSKRCSNECMQ